MSPTTRHYLISFAAGLLLTVVGILADQFMAHPDGNIDWRVLGFAVVGGVVLFLRDWLRNNAGAFLEGITPKQVESAVAQEGSKVLVPPVKAPLLDTLHTENPPT